MPPNISQPPTDAVPRWKLWLAIAYFTCLTGGLLSVSILADESVLQVAADLLAGSTASMASRLVWEVV